MSFRTFAVLSGLSLWVACSTEPTDFFGAPNTPAGTSNGGSAGSFAGVAGTGSDRGGTGGTHAGSGGDVGGNGMNGGTGNTAAIGGSSSPGGTSNNGGAGGTAAAMGGRGQGGSTSEAGMSGESGGGEPGVGGGSMAGESGTSPGGMAGESSSGTGGKGGTGGTSGTGGTTAGTGGTGGQPGACADDDACSDDEYCKKATCDAAMGVCTARATACTGEDATFDPVCGCDHMTYYTPCVAAREGVNVAKTGECTSGGAPCTRTGGSGDSCEPQRYRAACYRTRTLCNSDAAPDEGVCWVLPDTCPDEDHTQRDCNSGSPLCRGLCDALENKRPVIRDACNN